MLTVTQVFKRTGSGEQPPFLVAGYGNVGSGADYWLQQNWEKWISCILAFLLSQNDTPKKQAEVKDPSLFNIHASWLIIRWSSMPYRQYMLLRPENWQSPWPRDVTRGLIWETEPDWNLTEDRAAETDEREQFKYWGKIKRTWLGTSDRADGSTCWGLWWHLWSTNLGYLDGGPTGEKPMEVTGVFWAAPCNNGKCREKTWVQVTVIPQLQEFWPTLPVMVQWGEYFLLCPTQKVVMNAEELWKETNSQWLWNTQ